MKSNTLTIERASLKDASQIASLILPLAKKFVSYEYSAEGEALMLFGMGENSIREKLRAGYSYYLAYFHSQQLNPLAGVIGFTTKTNSENQREGHLYHLFVAEQYHRMGVAKALWQHLLKKTEQRSFSVNASRYAIEFYRRLGFYRKDCLYQSDGITCYPMYFERN